MTLTRRNALILPTAAALSVGFSGDGALAQTVAALEPKPIYWSWFKFSPAVLDKWNISETPKNPNLINITSRRIEAPDFKLKMLVVYPRPSSAYDIAISKILNVFEDKSLEVEITVVNFQNDDVLGKDVLRLAKVGSFDLIMAMGSETTAWLWDNYKNGDIPVVTVCSKDPVVLGQSPGYNRGSGTNFAFTSLNMPIDVQMGYVAELKPKLRNIAVLVDSRNVSAIETQAKPVITYAKAKGIRIIELSVQNPDNARAELERMVKDSTAQMMKNDPSLSDSIYWVTGSTSVFREIATINAHAGRAAVISVVPEIVRGGDDSAVLSIGISFESNAHMAAVYAADVIRNRSKASELKVGLVTPPDIAISFRKLREIAMTIPLSFFESAGTIYDYDGKAIRIDGVGISG
jgi:putative tryptophan/tyrosine transport system substrate-binding protein